MSLTQKGSLQSNLTIIECFNLLILLLCSIVVRFDLVLAYEIFNDAVIIIFLFFYFFHFQAIAVDVFPFNTIHLLFE